MAKMVAAGRRAFLIVFLTLVLSATANAVSLPVIVQISPTANIASIAAGLGATVIDSIPGANTYLLSIPIPLPRAPIPLPNLPFAPPNVPPVALPNLSIVLPPAVASFLGIQWAELNTGVSLPSFAVFGIVRVPGIIPADWYKYQPAWQIIEAQQARSYSTGRGIVIADINSQVDYGHPALAGHLTSGYDFVANKPAGSAVLNQSEAGFLDQSEAGFLDQSEAGFLDQSEAGFLDQSEAGFLDSTGLLVNPAYSHGTLCAGVIAAIAPDSMIMPLRTFDNKGRSDLFAIAKTIRYAVQHGAQVINMSFGTLNSSNSIQSAVQYAQQNGVLLTASAGNNNTSTLQYPAAYSGVMTAAATDLRDKKAAFSNYGSYIFVDAPGVNIISAYPGGYYGIVSGTSFSAPAVAATAALVRSLRGTGVANSIAAGSVNIDSNNPNYATQLGYGRIDVLRAVKPN